MKEYTEKKVSCILADGTMRVCSEARINVSTPFYLGQVEALIMDNPDYDLIFGNITGAISADTPSIDWKNEVSSLQSNLNKVTEQQEVNKRGTNAKQIKKCMETFLEVLELNIEVGNEQAIYYIDGVKSQMRNSVIYDLQKVQVK